MNESTGNEELALNVPAPAVPKVERLEAMLEAHRGGRFMIAIFGTPDPDSIASAWAHTRICRRFGVEAQIVYFKPVSHQENLALVKALEVEMLQWSERIDLSGFTGYCVVDSQVSALPATNGAATALKLVSFVDHHKSTGEVEAEFVDVREAVGSTCSIYAEYLEQGRAPLENGNAEDVRLATALMHGIRSDTDGFVLAREPDFRASAYLARFYDRELLRQISLQTVVPATMEVLRRALNSIDVYGSLLLAGVELVRDQDRDGIPQAADYLIRREGIDTAIVFGIVGEETIDGSLRTRSKTLDPDKFLKELLGVDAEGRSYGGGRHDKGGFQVPVGVFANCPDRGLLWQVAETTIKGLVRQALGLGLEARPGSASGRKEKAKDEGA